MELNTAKNAGERLFFRAIAERLGVNGALKSENDLVELVEERLPVAAISNLTQHGILEKEIYSVIVPRRTLQHRRARRENLRQRSEVKARRDANGVNPGDRFIRVALVHDDTVLGPALGRIAELLSTGGH